MIEFLHKHKKGILSGIFIYALCLTLFTPEKYNYAFNLLCCISYIATTIIYFGCRNKRNYMDFETMFFIAFFFVCFFYPVFIFPVDRTRFWIFEYAFNENLISRAAAICYLGAVSYMISYIFAKKTEVKSHFSPRLKTTNLFIISLVSFVIYIILGGYNALKNVYINGLRDQGGTYTYFAIIVYICIFCMISIWFSNSYNKSKKNFQWDCVPKLQMIYIIIYMVLMTFAGNRGTPLKILLQAIGLYTYLYRPFSFRKVLSLSVIGSVFMATIGAYRSGVAQISTSVTDLSMDLIISNRSLYEAINIVDNEGISFGKSMLAYVIGVIPLLQGFIFNLFGINPDTTTSAMIITQSILGTVDETGTGTTIIGDLYLAFGTVGVVVFMWILARFINYLEATGKNNIYLLTLYGVMTGVSVYLARAEFFYPARVLLWCVLAIYLSIHFRIDKMFR